MARYASGMYVSSGYQPAEEKQIETILAPETMIQYDQGTMS
jgi:hypothetical protein